MEYPERLSQRWVVYKAASAASVHESNEPPPLELEAEVVVAFVEEEEELPLELVATTVGVGTADSSLDAALVPAGFVATTVK